MTRPVGEPNLGGQSSILARISVNNPVLVNLVMVCMIVGGVYCAMTLVREMFPESRPDQVMITTVYPGASPAEVEKGISIKIEEKIKGIEGVDEMHTTILEGSSSIVVSMDNDYDDVNRAVDDIQAAIDTIPREDFPEEAEETQVASLEPRLPVISVAFYGFLPEETLKSWGRRVRDDLLRIEGITEVVLTGTRPDEISVEVSPARLAEFDLSFMEVADAIRRSNLDLPGGQVRTDLANVSVRTLGEDDQAEEIGRIIVRSDPRGRVIRVEDVATVIDGFEDVDLLARFNGEPAVGLTVYKTPQQDAIDIAAKVKAFIAGKTNQPFEQSATESITYRGKSAMAVYEQAKQSPYGELPGQLATYSNLARFIEGRLDLLTRNGVWGLILVFLVLLLFLNWLVAFWVMMGLVLSVLGTLMLMKGMGISLNLMTMFGMIVVLGMLVDDAIIVGENIYTKLESGMEPNLAAIEGTAEVVGPVTCAILTTVAAFAPLMFIEGRMGDFMGVLPVIVMFALAVSLFEAFTILPAHMAHSVRIRASAEPHETSRWLSRMRAAQQRFLKDGLVAGYEKLLRLAVRNRYVTAAIATGVLTVTIGAMEGGRVRRVFIQKMDSETIIGNLEMPVGTPIEQTEAACRIIDDAAADLDEIATRLMLAGTQFDSQGLSSGMRSHLAQVIMELEPVEIREAEGKLNSDEIMQELRRRTSHIAGANAIKFESMQGGPGGAPLQLEISGESSEDLIAVRDNVVARLRQFAGVFDIDDNLDAGRREVQIELLDSARAIGLTTESLATQVRAAFYGLEARKVSRDREDVKIMVRYPQEARRQVYDIESMRVATPAGVLVPFREVARLREGRSYAAIHRLNQQRAVTVTADVDDTVTSADNVAEVLEKEFAALSEGRDVRMVLGGQQRESQKSFGSLIPNSAAAGLLIFAILAGLFRSYVQPLIVMAAIPFGLIGAITGHYVMGYPMTILSAIGLVALTGIVVNDSLILVSFINRKVEAGVPVHEAVVDGGKARLRAILLTSITTIAGLAPLMAERSFQARFMIPMGVSISFGLAFSTVLNLIIVPALYVIMEDLKGLFRRAPRALVAASPNVSV